MLSCPEIVICPECDSLIPYLSFYNDSDWMYDEDLSPQINHACAIIERLLTIRPSMPNEGRKIMYAAQHHICDPNDLEHTCIDHICDDRCKDVPCRWESTVKEME